jgi:hypothetical protein
MDPPDPDRPCLRDAVSDSKIFGGKSPCFVFGYTPYFSFEIIDKWNIHNHGSTSSERSGHVMVFLIVFSVLICPG